MASVDTYGLPSEIQSHPLLKRLAPELRERVIQHLHGIALREGVHSGTSTAVPQRGMGSEWDRRSESAAPPNGHSHAQATMTTFPIDRAIQTDDVAPDGFPPQSGVNAGVGTTQIFDPPPHTAVHSPHRSVGVGPSPHHLQGSPPQHIFAGGPHYHSVPPNQTYPGYQGGGAPVGTYGNVLPPLGADADAHAAARAILSQHPAALGRGSEAHARMLGERLLAEHNRKNPPPLRPEYEHTAALGYPVPGGEILSGEGWGKNDDGATPLQRGIRNEFWRHFNAEFDRAVTLARDPDADSLLNIAADDYTPGPTDPFEGADFTAPVSHRARDDARRQIQSEFWNEYARQLDDKMRPPLDPYFSPGRDHYAAATAPPPRGVGRPSDPRSNLL